MKTSALSISALALAFGHASAFVPVRPYNNNARPSTHLFLEDRIAQMVDDELYREQHKEEFEKKWMEKNGNLILKHIEETSVYNGDEDDMESFRQHAKDKKMARENPVKYCADRCIATGNCEVYEDIFELSAAQVIAFCNDCVLDETKEECDLPGAFEEFMGENNGGVAP